MALKRLTITYANTEEHPDAGRFPPFECLIDDGVSTLTVVSARGTDGDGNPGSGFLPFENVSLRGSTITLTPIEG